MSADTPAFDERLYQRLLDSAPDGMLVVDRDGRIVLVNEQVETLFGYSRGELAGSSIERLIPERYAAAHPGHRERYRAGPTVRPMGSGRELYARRKDGREFPVEISLSPVPEHGLVSAIIRDISDRRRIEAGLRNLAAIVDSSKDGILSRDLEGRIISWNRGAEVIFGFTAAEMIGKTIARLIPLDREHEERDLNARALRGELIDHFETRRLRKDGSEIDVSVTISPVRDPEGRLIGTSKVSRDITERKRLEAVARRTHAHLLSAIESIDGAFAIFDADDRMVLCNSACRLLLGRRASELVGRRFPEILDDNLRGGIFDSGVDPEVLRERWLAYHRAPNGTFEVRTATGMFGRVHARRTSEGGTVVTVTDVTDDLLREDELRGARAAAEAASNAKSEFLASMSHELRTPLNSILGFAQLLVRDRKEPLSDRHRERVGHVIKAGEHLLRLIDDVLDLARIEAGRVSISVEPVGLPDVLEEVRTTLAPMAARAQIEIVIDPIAGTLPHVMADRTRLKQVLMNFGSNAIKYGRPGGTARFSAMHDGERIRVLVRDDGIGIPPEKQEKIFQPFHRAGQEAGPIEGTGIGLAITKRLAEQMEGQVGFESRLGVGSTFWIELPANDQLAHERARAWPAESSFALARRGERLVVVYIEDNPSNIAFMEDLLSDFERIELLTAPTAEIGIELVCARKPQLVIMDVNLPGMSGIEAASRLKQWPETRDIPVVALSAAVMPREKAAIEGGGFHRFLTKPVDVDELSTLLDDVLGPTKR